MRYLSEAIYNVLARLHTADKVAYGFMEPDTTAMPYDTFNVNAELVQNSSLSRVNYTLYEATVTVSTFCLTPEDAENRIRDIIDRVVAMEYLRSGNIVKPDVQSQDFQLEPDKDTQGRNVYRGTVIFSVMFETGTQDASSSSSSSTASSSSSSTASSSSSSTLSSSSTSTGSSSSSSTSTGSSSSSSTSSSTQAQNSSSSSSTSSYSSSSSSSTDSSGP